MLKDRARLSESGYIQLILDAEVAVQVAQDLELAIEKSPGLGYGS